MKSRLRILIVTCGLGLAATTLLIAAPRSMTIGSKPANFTLQDHTGKPHSLYGTTALKATVVLFIATQCPVSNAYNGRMAELARAYTPRGVKFIGINSNKQESASEMGDHAVKHRFSFPVVKDPNNVIADKWGALVTPEAFALDKDRVLRYHGRIDDSQEPGGVRSRDLKNALDAILAGKAPAVAETKAFGCTIKRV